MSDSKASVPASKPEEQEKFLPGESISPDELSRLMQQGSVRLIDVRTPAEFAYVHAEGATNVPLDQLHPAVVLGGSKEPVYLICRGGTRSREAAQRFREVVPGSAALVVEGGTLAWLEASLPVVWGKRRRKRLSAGSLAVGSIFLASGLLAIFVHRGLLGIAGLAGAWVVAINTFDPRQWPWKRESGITEASPG